MLKKSKEKEKLKEEEESQKKQAAEEKIDDYFGKGSHKKVSDLAA